jgi:hypothetical protein
VLAIFYLPHNLFKPKALNTDMGIMGSSSFIDVFMQVGLYSLWLIPVFGVYAYLRIFIDRYSIALKSTQHDFNVRMVEEADVRRTRTNMGNMSKSGDEDAPHEESDIRNMSPDERIIFCLEKGLILNLPVPVRSAKIGQVTGADTFSSAGDLLLVRGSYLTKDSISQLLRLDVDNVLVMFNPENAMAKKILA